MKYDFDAVVDRSFISTGKWEGEQARVGNTDFIGMGANEMDFMTPQPIIDTLVRTAEAGIFGYTYIKPDHYDSMIGFYQKHFNWTIDPSLLHHHQGIWKALKTILELITVPGDEIIFQPPVHAPFMRVLDLMKVKPVENPLRRCGDQYVMDFDQLETCFTKRTKAVFICNPENPTATVWKKRDLEKLSETCLRHNVKLISDDVYNSLTYEGHPYFPVANFSREAALNTITLVSPSKTFNLSGLNYALAILYDKDFGKRFDYQSNTLTSPSVMGFKAFEAAYTCEDWLSQCIEYIEGNQRFFAGYMKKYMPEFGLTRPEGLFVSWVDCSHMNLNRQELDYFFEQKANIGPRHGYAFGTGGEGFMRFNVACRRALLEEALNRFRQAYYQWKTEKKL